MDAWSIQGENGEEYSLQFVLECINSNRIYCYLLTYSRSGPCLCPLYPRCLLGTPRLDIGVPRTNWPLPLNAFNFILSLTAGVFVSFLFIFIYFIDYIFHLHGLYPLPSLDVWPWTLCVCCKARLFLARLSFLAGGQNGHAFGRGKNARPRQHLVKTRASFQRKGDHPLNRLKWDIHARSVVPVDKFYF